MIGNILIAVPFIIFIVFTAITSNERSPNSQYTDVSKISIMIIAISCPLMALSIVALIVKYQKSLDGLAKVINENKIKYFIFCLFVWYTFMKSVFYFVSR